jgi:TolA-binding protein
MKFILCFTAMMFTLIGCSRPSAEEMYKKAEDAQRGEQYDIAVTSFQELIKTYPDSARTPEAYYAVGTIYQNHLKSYHSAIQAFRQLADKYPKHPTSSSALFLVGFIYNNELKNLDSARFAYEEFIKRYPGDQLVVSAQFELNNLGKDPAEILKSQTLMTEEPPKKQVKEKKKK